MGCALSSLPSRGGPAAAAEGNDAVALCRERKRLAKKAVKQRLAFAEAHSAYIQSLSSVSSAIALFVARYSSSSAPPQFLIAFQSAHPPNSELDDAESGVSVCDNFYDDGSQSQPEEQGQVKWDFFDLLDTNTNSKQAKTTERKLRGEKESKGQDRRIPGHVKQSWKGNNGNGRELLEALKVVEDHFLRAHESGLRVSRMLEVNHKNQIPSHPPAFEDLQLQEISSRKWSVSSRSSSCKSLLSSSSTSTSSTWAESKGDRKSVLSSSSDNSSTTAERTSGIVDGSWGMVSGSHLFTLGRLYAWEKKLYHEVKAGDQTQKSYKQKCSHLRKIDLEGDGLCPSKAASEVTDLYHRMLVAFQRAESISKQIEKLRDEELQPQLVELLDGLMRTWEAMSDCHEIQKKIMQEIKSFNYSYHRKFCNDSHRLATLQLEAVLQNWQSCFSEYISTQKAYVKSLYGWLSKFVNEEALYYRNGSSSLLHLGFDGPTLVVACRNWLTCLERLPDKAVKNAMKKLVKHIQAMWVQQGEEQQQKRKVEGLAKEIDRKTLVIKKAEDKALLQRQMAHSNVVKDQDESLNEKKNQLDMLREKFEMEGEKHQSIVQETERMMINGLQMGFSSVFESLAEFSRASYKVYADLVSFSQNAKV